MSHRPTVTNLPAADDVDESQSIVKDDGTVPKKMKKEDVTENNKLAKRIVNLVDSV